MVRGDHLLDGHVGGGLHGLPGVGRGRLLVRHAHVPPRQVQTDIRRDVLPGMVTIRFESELTSFEGKLESSLVRFLAHDCLDGPRQRRAF